MVSNINRNINENDESFTVYCSSVCSVRKKDFASHIWLFGTLTKKTSSYCILQYSTIFFFSYFQDFSCCCIPAIHLLDSFQIRQTCPESSAKLCHNQNSKWVSGSWWNIYWIPRSLKCLRSMVMENGIVSRKVQSRTIEADKAMGGLNKVFQNSNGHGSQERLIWVL